MRLMHYMKCENVLNMSHNNYGFLCIRSDLGQQTGKVIVMVLYQILHILFSNVNIFDQLMGRYN